MAFILGKKLGMTQVFDNTGKVKPVTFIEAGPVTVTQVITQDKNHYNALQLGFGYKKKAKKPVIGQFKGLIKDNKGSFGFVREFRIEDVQNFKKGDSLLVDQFNIGDKVNVRGITKGKGFQGVVKRWGFKGGPKTHGTKNTLRAPGSIGSAFPQHVFKGLKMAGHLGAQKKTILHLEVVYLNKEKNLLGLKGAIPGNVGGYLEIIKS